LKRFQKVPDDVRMQKVLEVLDTDKDGLIDINHVLKV
jgi:Ca2+-binding EF-hand superfamily protein